MRKTTAPRIGLGTLFAAGIHDYATRYPEIRRQPPLLRDDAPRIEASGGPGWFLVYGRASGPVGAFGEEEARRKLAQIEAEVALARAGEVLP